MRLYVGAGCFWSVEAAFYYLHGIESTQVGHIAVPFEGAPVITAFEEAPALWRVEVVALEVDLAKMPVQRLMEVFWAIHTPTLVSAELTTDVSNCRSLWVVEDPAIRQVIQASVDAYGATLAEPIQTRVWPAASFQPASQSDQGYYQSHPKDGYCQSHIVPRLNRLWEAMPEQFNLAD